MSRESGLIEKSKLFAACGLQKAYRGFKDRQRVRLILWRRYEKAASTVQAAYRKWRDAKNVDEKIIKNFPKDRKLYRACKRSAPLKQRMKLNQDLERQEPTSVLFRKCLRGTANHSDKMAIWRAIIELRRGHPYWSTHIAFKAMIESRGDLAKSLNLMADETFALKNEGDVPMQLQRLFVPALSAPSSSSSKEGPLGPESSRSGSPINPGFGTTFQGTGLTGLRNLRTSRAAGGNSLDFSPLLVRSYFSKYYAGARLVHNPCRKPQGFEPHMLGPLSPRADGSILQGTDNSIKHGMKANISDIGVPVLAVNTLPIYFESRDQTGTLHSYIANGATYDPSAGIAKGSRAIMELSPRMKGSPVGAPKQTSFGTPTPTWQGKHAPSKDTELLAGLLQLQQKMDSLAY